MTPPNPPRPVRGRPRDSSSRDQLLDAAASLMSERGAVNFTFTDISARSGLNSALVRYNFGSKEGLLMALLERDAGSTFKALDALVSSDMDAVSKLRHHIEGVIKIYHRHPYMNRLIGVLGSEIDSETARFMSERFTKPLAKAQAIIMAQGRAEGVFREIDPTFFYFSLIGACDHLFHARSALKHAFGIDQIDDDMRARYARHLIDLLLGSVLTEPKPS